MSSRWNNAGPVGPPHRRGRSVRRPFPPPPPPPPPRPPPPPPPIRERRGNSQSTMVTQQQQQQPQIPYNLRRPQQPFVPRQPQHASVPPPTQPYPHRLAPPPMMHPPLPPQMAMQQPPQQPQRRRPLQLPLPPRPLHLPPLNPLPPEGSPPGFPPVEWKVGASGVQWNQDWRENLKSVSPPPPQAAQQQQQQPHAYSTAFSTLPKPPQQQPWNLRWGADPRNSTSRPQCIRLPTTTNTATAVVPPTATTIPLLPPAVDASQGPEKQSTTTKFPANLYDTSDMDESEDDEEEEIATKQEETDCKKRKRILADTNESDTEAPQEKIKRPLPSKQEQERQGGRQTPDKQEQKKPEDPTSSPKDVRHGAMEQPIAKKLSPEDESKRRQLKEKLLKAKFKLVQALRQKRTSATAPPKKKRVGKTKPPPMSALSPSLLVTEISKSGPNELVRYLPVPEPDHDLEYISDTDTEDNDAVENGSDEELKDKKMKSAKIQRTLLSLKKKLHEMAQTKSRKQEQEPKVLSKQELMKRQEELKQTMDVAYWRQLVVKHRNLLQAEEQVVLNHKTSLAKCRQELSDVQSEVGNHRENVQDCQVRQDHLSKLIEAQTNLVLSKRSELRQCRERMASKSKKPNVPTKKANPTRGA